MQVLLLVSFYKEIELLRGQGKVLGMIRFVREKGIYGFNMEDAQKGENRGRRLKKMLV